MVYEILQKSKIFISEDLYEWGTSRDIRPNLGKIQVHANQNVS